MKTRLCAYLFVLATLFISCSKGESLELHNIATPEYMPKEDFRASVKISTPRDIE